MTSALHASRGGREGEPSLLLVHPMGADHTFWDECRREWERSFHCVAVDLRGAGRSPALTAPRTVETHAADLEAFCATQGLGRVVVVGCAVGAMIAAAFAARSGDRCAAAILSNPGYRTLPEARSALAGRAAEVRKHGMIAASGAVDRSFEGHPDREQVERYRRHFLAQDAEAYALQIEGMLDADVSGALAAIECPTLVVGGGRDRLLPLEHAQQAVAVLQDGDLVVVPEAAHFTPYQYPGLFAGLVLDFLARRDIRPT